MVPDNKERISVEKIISGGQSGVDRAALDFALAHGIPCGGWCPKGRLAEDGRIDEKYPLTQTETSLYAERTRLNVKHSDGTLILFTGELGNGTILTQKTALKLKKPCLLICLEENRQKEQARELLSWLKANHIAILNIAGPRESSSPGIYSKTLKFLNELT